MTARRALVSPVLLATLAAASTEAAAGPRSERTAYAVSGVSTGASGALFLSAFLAPRYEGDVNMVLLFSGLGSAVVTPSFGQWYAGRYLTPGLAIRAAAGGLATWATIEYRQVTRCETQEYAECTSLTRGAIVYLGLAAVAFVGGAVLDFRDIPGSVAAHNRQHRLQIAPTLTAAPGGARFALVGTF